MTSHEERAREWLRKWHVGDLDSSLAAEFAAVEAEVRSVWQPEEVSEMKARGAEMWANLRVAELQQRVAALEAALKELHAATMYWAEKPHTAADTARWSKAMSDTPKALSGEPTALLALLRDAARHGLATRGEVADPEGWCDTLAKRVWEGK